MHSVFSITPSPRHGYGIVTRPAWVYAKSTELASCEDVVLNGGGRHREIAGLAKNYKGQGCSPREESRLARDLSQSVWNMRSQWITEFIDRDVEKHGPRCPPRRHRRPLMQAECRGRSFGSEKCFCRRSSNRTVMKQAVVSAPFHGRGKAQTGKGERSSAGHILMSTVKGDVHDIGKNIVGVLACTLRDHRSRGHGPAPKFCDRREEKSIHRLSLITPRRRMFRRRRDGT